MGLIIKGPSIPMGFPTIFPYEIEQTDQEPDLPVWGWCYVRSQHRSRTRRVQVQVCVGGGLMMVSRLDGVLKAVKTGVAYLE